MLPAGSLFAGFWGDLWTAVKAYVSERGNYLYETAMLITEFTGSVMILDLDNAMDTLEEEAENFACGELPIDQILRINKELREGTYIFKPTNGRLDSYTKEKMRLYDDLFPVFNFKDGQILDQIRLHSGDLPLPDFMEGDSQATALGKHIFFKKEFLLPYSKYYSPAGATRADVLPYAEKWQDELGLSGIFSNYTSLSAISTKDFETIQYKVDEQYEINFARLGHELVHTSQAVDAGGLLKQSCKYMLEMIDKEYHKNKFETPAWKIQSLIYADFAVTPEDSSGKIYKHSDQDGVPACIPSIIKNETWCHDSSKCAHQPYGEDLADCSEKWDNCTEEFVSDFWNEQKDKLLGGSIDRDIIMDFFTKCTYVDNCPMTFNPGQEGGLRGHACSKSGDANCSQFFHAQDLDHDCAANGLKTVYREHGDIGDLHRSLYDGSSKVKFRVKYGSDTRIYDMTNLPLLDQYGRTDLHRLIFPNFKRKYYVGYIFATAFPGIFKDEGESLLKNYLEKMSFDTDALKNNAESCRFEMNFDSELISIVDPMEQPSPAMIQYYEWTFTGFNTTTGKECYEKKYAYEYLRMMYGKPVGEYSSANCGNDSDKCVNNIDNCPERVNNIAVNTDRDSFGDLCDPDIDGDGTENSVDGNMFVKGVILDNDIDFIPDGVTDVTMRTECRKNCLNLITTGEKLFSPAAVKQDEFSLDWIRFDKAKKNFISDFYHISLNYDPGQFCSFVCEKRDNCKDAYNLPVMEKDSVIDFPDNIDPLDSVMRMYAGATRTAVPGTGKTIGELNVTGDINDDYALWQPDFNLNGAGDVCDMSVQYATVSSNMQVDIPLKVRGEACFNSPFFGELCAPSIPLVLENAYRDVSVKISGVSNISGNPADELKVSGYYCHCREGRRCGINNPNNNPEIDCAIGSLENRNFNHASDIKHQNWVAMTSVIKKHNSLTGSDYNSFKDMDSESSGAGIFLNPGHAFYPGSGKSGTFRWDWKGDVERYYGAMDFFEGHVPTSEEKKDRKVKQGGEYKFFISSGVAKKGGNIDYNTGYSPSDKRNNDYFYNNWLQEFWKDLWPESNYIPTAKYGNARRHSSTPEVYSTGESIGGVSFTNIPKLSDYSWHLRELTISETSPCLFCRAAHADFLKKLPDGLYRFEKKLLPVGDGAVKEHEGVLYSFGKNSEGNSELYMKPILEGQVEWIQIAGNLPYLTNPSIVPVGRSIFIGGGKEAVSVISEVSGIGNSSIRFSSSNSFFRVRRCHSSEESCEIFKELAALPETGGKLFSVNGGLYFVGSSDAFDIHRYDAENDVWDKVETVGENPGFRNHFAMTVSSNALYIAGGADGSGAAKRDVWKLNFGGNGHEEGTHEGSPYGWEKLPIELPEDALFASVEIDNMNNISVIYPGGGSFDNFREITVDKDFNIDVKALEAEADEENSFIPDYCLDENGGTVYGGLSTGGECAIFMDRESSYYLGKTVYSIEGGESILYAATESGVTAIDISDIENPFITSELALYGPVKDVELIGDIIYAAAGNGIAVIDVSDPGNIVQKEFVTMAGDPSVVRYFGEMLYVGDSIGIKVFSLSNPEQPELYLEKATAGDVEAIHITDERVYLYDWGGFKVHERSDLSHIKTKYGYCEGAELREFDGKLYSGCGTVIYRLEETDVSFNKLELSGDKIFLKDNHIFDSTGFAAEGSSIILFSELTLPEEETPEEPTQPVCGNGIVEEGEVCDSNVVNCTTLNPSYISGTATCNSDCTGYNETECEIDDGW